MNKLLSQICLTVAVLFAVSSVATGCATARVKTRTCAVVLLMDGQHLHPSVRQFEAVQRKFSPEFEKRSLSLVPDLRSAELIATIESCPDPADSRRSLLIVRDIAVNTFTPVAGKVSHPSLEQSDREHFEAVRGFSRPGID